MEAAVSSSMGAMGAVLRKLDLLLAPESQLRKRVKDGIGLLKQDLEVVSSALVDLSMLETPSPSAKCWMEEARELSYLVEDFLDELMLKRTDSGAKIRAISSHRVGRVKIALLPAPPRRSTRVAKIAHLRDLVWQATERLERYELDACCSTKNHMNVITQHRRAPALYGDAANLVGIEESRTKLIEMLTGEAEQELKVVSIVGPAGVGKTTLAKEIFRELRGLFDLRAFVHASRKPDMRRLLGSILSQVQPHHQLPSVAGTVQSLIDSIQEQLRDKRYLIVIDDLWEETAWDIVRGAFPEGNNSSRIVATTENMNVALKCCSYMADNSLKMKPLGNQDSGYLFFNRVFGSEQQCPDELKEVSYGIIRKCCGLPLSVIHVAGLLSSIDYSELWYNVHDCLCSILDRSHTVEEIQKKILNLSYNSLPHCLKTCLLYFNMYPEGYIMWKVHLVKQWIAEGFINAAEGKDREEIAEGYFEELVNRGMVQPMKIDYKDEVLSCTVHHVIFDLIYHNCKQEEFIAAIDYSQPITALSTKAHRQSFQLSSAKYAKQPARITMSQLRSLGLFGFIKCMPPIVEFKHLRVLVLDFWGSHDGHMGLNLSRICILFQLRYLKISGDIMVELPAQMQGLHYLETLEIDTRLSAVPLDIVHLPSLLHLGLRAATKLPDGIGHIKSLSTLLYFDLRCNSEENIRSLGQLTNLQHLHLTFSADLSSDHLKRKLIPLAFTLGKLGNLKSLTLTPDALRTSILFDISSGISSPSMFLKRVELLPPICFFSRLPTWFGELHKLRILKLVVKELQGNDINNIAGLPSLVVFSLFVQTSLTGTIVFCSMAFRALKYFKFTCGVMCLAFQAGAMPNLQRVKLCFNAHRGKSHNRVLDGIEHLLNLQEVVGRIGVLPGADESNWRVVKLSFEDIIRKHPRCPRFNSQPVDFILEEYPPLDKFHLRRHEGSSSEHEIVEKACAKDMDKHIDSRLSREFDLPPASGTSCHHKSDEYSEHYMLVSILRDESAEPTTLDLSLLEDITNNFSTEQEVDQGGFGTVYKGILGDGIIAVKRLCGPRGTADLAYIFHCLMTVKHSNIVRFLGYWEPQPNAIKKWGSIVGIEQQDMLLCFEYLHNGSLRRHITEESCGFAWHTCYQIIKGICQGLDYLHKNSVTHLHLKPENILLDANMVPKVADYAYARLLGEHRPTGTQENVTLLDYMAPEYQEDGAISLKSDIYSLGVIIMQMVAGNKDHPNIKSVLGGWRSRLESDTSLRHTALEAAYRQVILCIVMGESCMHRDPSKRPCIRDIIDRFAEGEIIEATIAGGCHYQDWQPSSCMANDNKEVMGISQRKSCPKVHSSMCSELKMMLDKISSVLPSIEDARPGCKAGIQELCNLYSIVEKGRLIITHCIDCSKLYLAITGQTIVARCERIRDSLRRSLFLIQNMVPPALANQIAEVHNDLRDVKFVLDRMEEEAGEAILQMLRHSDASEELELETFLQAASKLELTSPKAVLSERRAIKKLLDKVKGNDPKKEGVLMFFLYLIKKYGKSISQDSGEQNKNLQSGSQSLTLSTPSCDSSTPGKCYTPTDFQIYEDHSNMSGPAPPPPEFCCPISTKLMHDPVIITSGQTYERENIERWFNEGHDTCPRTQMKLENFSMIPNTCMRDFICNWCKEHGFTISNFIPPRENAYSYLPEQLHGYSMPSLHNVSVPLIAGKPNSFVIDCSNTSVAFSDASYVSNASHGRDMEDSKDISQFSWNMDNQKYLSTHNFNKEMFLNFFHELCMLPLELQDTSQLKI